MEENSYEWKQFFIKNSMIREMISYIILQASGFRLFLSFFSFCGTLLLESCENLLFKCRQIEWMVILLKLSRCIQSAVYSENNFLPKVFLLSFKLLSILAFSVKIWNEILLQLDIFRRLFSSKNPRARHSNLSTELERRLHVGQGFSPSLEHLSDFSSNLL